MLNLSTGVQKMKTEKTILDIRKAVTDKYGFQEEYLTNHYPSNYFDYFIDVGTRGTFNPWHINNIGKNNPDTTCLGFEPDLPYYRELVDEINKENLNNVFLHPEGFGSGGKIPTPQGDAATVTLSQILNKYKIDPDKKWMIKFDCEGCEYALMEPKSSEDVELLKKADHIAFEIHDNGCGKNFFTTNNPLPNNLTFIEDWMDDTFSETHTTFLTCIDPGCKTYILLSNRLMEETKDLFWKEIIDASQ